MQWMTTICRIPGRTRTDDMGAITEYTQLLRAQPIPNDKTFRQTILLQKLWCNIMLGRAGLLLFRACWHVSLNSGYFAISTDCAKSELCVWPFRFGETEGLCGVGAMVSSETRDWQSSGGECSMHNFLRDQAHEIFLGRDGRTGGAEEPKSRRAKELEPERVINFGHRKHGTGYNIISSPSQTKRERVGRGGPKPRRQWKNRLIYRNSMSPSGRGRCISHLITLYWAPCHSNMYVDWTI